MEMEESSGLMLPTAAAYPTDLMPKTRSLEGMEKAPSSLISGIIGNSSAAKFLILVLVEVVFISKNSLLEERIIFLSLEREEMKAVRVWAGTTTTPGSITFTANFMEIPISKLVDLIIRLLPKASK